MGYRMCDMYRSMCDTPCLIYVVSRIRRHAFAYARYDSGFRRMKFENCTLLPRQHHHHSHHGYYHMYLGCNRAYDFTLF